MSVVQDVDVLKAALDKHRPINREKMAVIAEKLNIEWTYHSNAIEGNTLTLAETSFFLREGLTVEGKPVNDFLAAKNHYEAIHFLEDCLNNRDVTEALIKEIHALVLRGIDHIEIGSGPSAVRKRIHPGQYKYDNNHVLLPDGSIHRYCDHLQVPGEMEKLVRWHGEHRGSLHPIELAAGFHHRLVAIHPFTDGNGRVARLMMNLILMQAGYPPAIVRNEERREYYAALRAADGGNLSPFITLVGEAVARTLRLMLDVVEGRLGLTPDDVKVKIDRLSRTDRSSDESEIIRKAKEAGEKVNEWVGQVLNQLIVPSGTDRRFVVELRTTFIRSFETSSGFFAFCRRQGFKPLGLSTFPDHSHQLNLSFPNVPFSNWSIWFEVALTQKEVLLIRNSTEIPSFEDSFIMTPVLSPDRKQVEEFVLREVAAFIERAGVALDLYERDTPSQI